MVEPGRRPHRRRPSAIGLIVAGHRCEVPDLQVVHQVLIELGVPTGEATHRIDVVQRQTECDTTRKEPLMTAPVELTDRYTQGVDLARKLHAGEPRKGTAIPYLAHPLSVSALVLEHGGTEDQSIAALLHDTAEDHGGHARIDQIRAEFGDTVADIVAACSDSLVEDRNKKAPWWDRKVAYLKHLASETAEVALVSAADKLHNARSILNDYRNIGDELWKRFNKDAGRPGTLWYYTRLAEILTDRLAGTHGAGLARELTDTVDEIVALVAGRGHHPDDEIADGRAREAEVLAHTPVEDA